MRVRVIIEVPDFKRFHEVQDLTRKLDALLWQEVSGYVIGMVIEERRSDAST